MCFFYTKNQGGGRNDQSGKGSLESRVHHGDYRTIKEFAEAKGIEYNSTFRKMASLERWTKDKNEHLEQIYKKTVKKHEQKRVEDALRDATARQNKTLEATSLVREKALKLLGTAKSAKEVNAIASALYRINEIERGLLNYDKGNTDDAKNRLVEVIEAIKGASEQ